ncbi:hypothetical protein PDENDC454_10490 [Paenibacillus dendritiformis C454]|uniref:AP2 domain-containing protein n=1 Tax=Paenibacillus dendritiformis C454 TaxID=1131935 RepID=H3SEZ3_9BACL|nr:AP2 domain-containing protein [Paenibacillus dendritiformis]EHQ62312.1 hypothetical protein PDENDC454_10490 [Paenibacillus dendritiformis C454]
MSNKVEIGMTFGELTVLRQHAEKLHKERAWVCLCSCGNETLATNGQLVRGVKKSCGCLRKKTPANALDLTGQRFGRLNVIERAGTTAKGNALWRCACDCGNEKIANATLLRRGDIVSCGCASSEQIDSARTNLLTSKSIDGVQVPRLTQKVRSDSGTGHKGITRRYRNGKEIYEAYISVKKIRKHVGTFSDLDKAIRARDKAEKEYHAPYIKALEEKENEQRGNKEVD